MMLEYSQVVLVAIEGAAEQESFAFSGKAIQCPDCYAPIEVYYDQDQNPKYQCENCGQEASTMDINREWDDDDVDAYR